VVRPLRRARLAVSLVFFAHGALFGTWAARIPAIRAELDLTTGELGTAFLAGTIGGVGVLPIAGVIVARRGSRPTVVWGLPLFALLLPALALAPSLPLLALALFASGVVGGAVDVAMNAHGLAVERHYEGPIFSSMHAAWSFGGLAGGAGAALAAGLDVDPVPHFAAVAAVLGITGVVASQRFLPAAADRPEEPPRLGFPPLRLVPLAVLAFAGLFAEAAAMDWSAVYVAGPAGGGEELAPLGFATFSLAMAVFRLVGDPLTNRLGPVVLTRLGGVVAAAGLALALAVASVPAALAGFVLMGAGLAAVVPIVFRAAGSLPGLPIGAGIAALTTVGYGAFIVAPPTIGFVADASSLRTALWIVVALVVMLVPLARTTRAAE
jgi:MFS family permease